jgi:lipopolysaccharide/colanic/teichoic acid biosynthesis glycosyltransferase
MAATRSTFLARARINHFLYLNGLKRIIDLVGASALLILVSPILLLALIWIALDSAGNPVLLQPRVGRGGRQFTMLKLRTMQSGAPEVVIWTIDKTGTGVHKVRGDPRVTRAGKWLRRFSIDELPQLVNVIKGDMSLVGPRPELPQIVSGYQPWQHARHQVRPGITGWWQVSGRSNRPMHENTHLDLYYVNNVTLWLDIVIITKTIPVVVKCVGAY